jgi:hypothetical protein
MGLALAGLLLTVCQTIAQTGPNGVAAVQMIRDTAFRGEIQPAASARRMAPPPRIYLMRGLANVFSQGMDHLADKLMARGYQATVHPYGDWSAIAADILARQRASGGRFQAVVVGHSLGANAVTDLVNAVGAAGGTVALAVTFDPTVPQPVSGGARRYINLFQSNNGWGTTVTAAPGFSGRIQNFDLRNQPLTHFNIDKDPRLHAQVIGWIVQTVGPPRGAGRHAAAR